MRRFLASSRGFTLVELLVAAGLLSIIFGMLSTSFWIGLTAYHRNEESLGVAREKDIFLFQLDRELKSTFVYSPRSFIGKEDSLAFPAKIHRDTPHGADEGLYWVEYHVKKGKLFRTERALTKTLRDRGPVREALFDSVQLQFEFLYLDASHALVWEPVWPGNKTGGLPRGVRVTAAGNVFGKKTTSEILIPHGLLLERS